MATRTLGTAANNTLTAILWASSGAGLLPADIATIANGIIDDQSAGGQAAQTLGTGGFSIIGGQLYVPNRGILTVKPGDFIGIDGTGWPILVSAKAAASASWSHS